ncbi:hypothetical protein PanWU01x14_085690 [Parasponia andersonii]|uniref:Uncharacterized protein n=1 Tax=Parasponia andersonii TaxID=3476 RepID=A0A2P5D922_PARAD|nr:hypothetical protein PanWU01x14_085690 [Parasponia andersonii]
MSELFATQMEARTTSSDEFDAEENHVQLTPPRIDETLIAAEAFGIHCGHKTRDTRSELQDIGKQLDELRALMLRTVSAVRVVSSSNQPSQDNEIEHLDDD